MIPITLASIFTGPEAAPNGMLYDLPLKPVGLALGVALLVGHLIALWKQPLFTRMLPKFPRSTMAGMLLLTLATLWALLIVWRIDLGELQPFRLQLMCAVVVLYGLAIWQMREFLAVRALGMLFLLGAEVLLDAAFLRLEPSRLFLPVLAYGWVMAGLFWIGMPWLLRDHIEWVVAKAWRYRATCALGIAYGAVVLGCALFFYT
ncbi:MAG: hypothetical protein SNJ52_03290 [Verrucomicrobiia bacterium]